MLDAVWWQCSHLENHSLNSDHLDRLPFDDRFRADVLSTPLLAIDQHCPNRRQPSLCDAPSADDALDATPRSAALGSEHCTRNDKTNEDEHRRNRRDKPAANRNNG